MSRGKFLLAMAAFGVLAILLARGEAVEPPVLSISLRHLGG